MPADHLVDFELSTAHRLMDTLNTMLVPSNTLRKTLNRVLDPGSPARAIEAHRTAAEAPIRNSTKMADVEAQIVGSASAPALASLPPLRPLVPTATGAFFPAGRLRETAGFLLGWASRGSGAAERAHRRRAYAVASGGFERAARLSPQPDARAERWLLAAQTAWSAGLTERTLALLDEHLSGSRAGGAAAPTGWSPARRRRARLHPGQGRLALR